jgi:Lon protease-like protein
MFPLQTVVFPFGVLPLHVFEERYRRMIADCLADDGRFGVVLIERGSEVGGGDSRASIGTEARIVEHQELEDGRFIVVAVGIRRIAVENWLPDDPYPRANVAVLEEPPAPAGVEARVPEAARALRRLLLLYSELGVDVGDAAIEFGEIAGDAVFQMCAVAPTGPLDAQQMLEAPDSTTRLTLLEDWIADESATLERRLAGG